VDDSDWLDAYQADALQGERLDSDTERALAAAAHGGDDRARDDLHRATKRLVLSIARKYQRVTPTSFAQLVRAGDEGLATACDRFDPASQRSKFSAFATWWIRQAITQRLREG